MQITPKQILSKIKDSKHIEKTAELTKNDIVDIVDTLLFDERQQVFNVCEYQENLNEDDPIRKKLEKIYNHNGCQLPHELVYWEDDPENDFLIYGEVVDVNKLLLKVKLRANNTGGFFKDMDGTASIIIDPSESTSEMFLDTKDMELLEKQADLWSERNKNKDRLMQIFVSNLADCHNDNSVKGIFIKTVERNEHTNDIESIIINTSKKTHTMDYDDFTYMLYSWDEKDYSDKEITLETHTKALTDVFDEFRNYGGDEIYNEIYDSFDNKPKQKKTKPKF